MSQVYHCHCGTKVQPKEGERRAMCPNCGSVVFFPEVETGDEIEAYGIAGADDAPADLAPAESFDASGERAPNWLDRYKLTTDAHKPETQKLLEAILKTGKASAASDPHAAAVYLALTQPAADTTIAALARISASGHPVYAPLSASFLACIGPSEAGAAQQVLNLLHETQSLQTVELLTACLARIGPTPVVHVKSLMKVLDSKHTVLATWAAECLKLIGPAARNAVDNVLKALKIPRQELRLAGIDALGAIGDQPQRVVPILLQALKHQDAEYRKRGARALGRFGTAALDSLPALQAALEDGDPEVQQAATQAVEAIAAAQARAAATPGSAAPAAATAAEPILVKCQCGGKLKIKAALAGKKGKCPACGTTFTVPTPPSKDGAKENEKTCPACLAVVPSAVILCVHCGLDFRTGKPLGAMPAPVVV